MCAQKLGGRCPGGHLLWLHPRRDVCRPPRRVVLRGASLAEKFPVGCSEQAEVAKWKASFEADFQEFTQRRGRDRPAPAASAQSMPEQRLAATCDYSIDAEPIDWNWMVDLPAIKAADFAIQSLLAKNNKCFRTLNAFHCESHQNCELHSYVTGHCGSVHKAWRHTRQERKAHHPCVH